MFTARIVSTFTALFTVFSVENVSEHGGESKTLLLDLGIVITNILLIIATVWLVRVTTREARESAEKALAGEQETNRLLIRVIRGMSRRQTGAKHRKGAATKEGSDR
jgi:hypothetical protein